MKRLAWVAAINTALAALWRWLTGPSPDHVSESYLARLQSETDAESSREQACGAPVVRRPRDRRGIRPASNYTRTA